MYLAMASLSTSHCGAALALCITLAPPGDPRQEAVGRAEIESLASVAALDERLELSIRSAEEEREEGGSEWVAQWLLDETLSPHLRNEAGISAENWRRVQVAARAVIARELIVAANPRGAVAQLRELESTYDVDHDELTHLWSQCAALLPKPSGRDGSSARAEFFLAEFAAHIARVEPKAAIGERLRELCKRAGAKLRPPRDVAAARETPDPGKRGGLVMRHWRGERDKLESRLRRKAHARTADFEPDSGGRVTFFFHQDVLEELGDPPYVARIEGSLVVDEPGLYRLRFKADDAGRISVAESRVVDTWSKVTEVQQGKYYNKMFVRELWLDAVTPLVIDMWDEGGIFEMLLWLERPGEPDHWKRVPFAVTHDRPR